MARQGVGSLSRWKSGERGGKRAANEESDESKGGRLPEQGSEREATRRELCSRGLRRREKETG